MRIDQCRVDQLVVWLRTPKAPDELQAFVPGVVAAVHAERVTVVVRSGSGRLVRRVVDPVRLHEVWGPKTPAVLDVIASGIRSEVRGG